MSKRRRTSIQGQGAQSQEGRTTLSRVTAEIESYEGWLPHPQILAGYEAISPGMIEWVKERTALQQNHRMNLETTVVSAQMRQSHTGQIFAFVLGLGSLAVAGLGFYWKQPLEGLGAVVIAIGSIAIAYIYGKSKDAKERAEKDKVLHPVKP